MPENYYITEFQRKCISKISHLCNEKKKMTFLWYVFSTFSGAFCILSTILSAIILLCRAKKNENTDFLSVCAFVISFAGLICAVHSVDCHRRGEEISEHIDLLEKAVNISEKIPE